VVSEYWMLVKLINANPNAHENYCRLKDVEMMADKFEHGMGDNADHEKNNEKSCTEEKYDELGNLLNYEYPDALAERIDIDLHALSLKGKLVLARDEKGGTEYICLDRELIGNFAREFDKVIHAISVDRRIALASGDKLYVLDENGDILWNKKIKGLSIIAHRGNSIAAYGKNKITVFDIEGKKLYKVKVKDVLSMDIGEHFYVGTKDGLQIFLEKEELGRYELGVVTGIKILDDNLVLSTEKEVMEITKTGRVIWKKTVTHDLEDTILDLCVSPEGIRVHTFSGKNMIISTDGKSVTTIAFPFRYLPKPRVSLPFMLEDIENTYKLIGTKSKDMKKLMKTSRKHLKKDNFNEALFTTEMAMETLNRLQLQVKIPSKVSGEFEIVLKPHNYTLKELKVVYDLSEMKDYFRLSKDVVEFPPIMRGMTVEEIVKAEPIYTGKIPFKVNIISTKTSFTFVQTLHVKKESFIASLISKLLEGKAKKKKEERKRLSDILMNK
jgi:hypothetical protein